MEDKENDVDTAAVDRHHQQQRGGGSVAILKAANRGGMLPLASSATHSLKKAAADGGASFAATPRSIGSTRMAHFSATPLGQRKAGDASSVRIYRRTNDKKQLNEYGRGSSFGSFFSFALRMLLLSRGALQFALCRFKRLRGRINRLVPISRETRRIAAEKSVNLAGTLGGERANFFFDNGYIGGGDRGREKKLSTSLSPPLFSLSLSLSLSLFPNETKQTTNKNRPRPPQSTAPQPPPP
jgi:hypothetical protein